jgi:hypothetical protein
MRMTRLWEAFQARVDDNERREAKRQIDPKDQRPMPILRKKAAERRAGDAQVMNTAAK